MMIIPMETKGGFRLLGQWEMKKETPLQSSFMHSSASQACSNSSGDATVSHFSRFGSSLMKTKMKLKIAFITMSRITASGCYHCKESFFTFSCNCRKMFAESGEEFKLKQLQVFCMNPSIHNNEPCSGLLCF